jgi:purine-nucleoside phosphorylase
LVAGKISGVYVLIFSGRVHYYEGYTMQEICFPVRVMKGLGVKIMIITNASGAVNESFSPGEIIAISDHINLMGDNPLRGTTHFQDMTEAYSPELRKLAYRVSEKLGIALKEGVYLVMNGPSYETPAEIRMARNLGADLVGMSTIPEVIMAKNLGITVLGLSVVTNMAAGISGTPLSHKEVIETTKKAAEQFRKLVRGIVERL